MKPIDMRRGDYDMDSRQFKVLTTVLATGLLVSLALLSPNVAFSDFTNTDLKNGRPKDSTPVNDLRVRLDHPLAKDTVGDFVKPTLRPIDAPPGGGGQTTANSVSADGRTATFDAGNIPGGSLQPGGSLTVRFEAPEGTKVDKSASGWTVNTEFFAGSVATTGQAPGLFFRDGSAFAQFTNPEPFGVIYSNIRLFRDNNIANFNIDMFDVPTGQLVTGIPSSITLGPGQSSDPLPFGMVDPRSYQLALATAAAVSTPDETFGLGAASAVIPEPPALTLLTIGGLGLLGYRWRYLAHRRSASSLMPSLTACPLPSTHRK